MTLSLASSCKQIPAAVDEENPENNPVISVKELMENQKITSLPQCYIRSDQRSLINKNDNLVTEIPIIDMQKLLGVADTSELEKLHSTCKEWGIFQLVNHGVMCSVMEKLKDGMEEFYRLRIEEKMKYKLTPGEVEGYGPVARSQGKHDWCDRLFMVTNPIHRRKSHLFPQLPSSLRDALESYTLELQKLGIKLFGVMAKALKIESKEMEETFENGMQSVRMTYYPPCPQPELVNGIVPHSDATGLTFVHQVNGIDGLQIKKDGVWLPVSFHQDALVVNVGDVLEILSNGIYHSVEHQVKVNSEKGRMSIAFFINPKFEVNVGPSTTLVNKENPPLFKTVPMEDYIKALYSHILNGRSFLDSMRL